MTLHTRYELVNAKGRKVKNRVLKKGKTYPAKVVGVRFETEGNIIRDDFIVVILEVERDT